MSLTLIKEIQNMKSDCQLNIRVRLDLLKSLKQLAKKNRRTMQAEHEIILMNALEEVKLENTEEQQSCNTQ